MGLSKSIRKRYFWARDVRLDRQTGFYQYQRFNHPIFIRYPRHYLEERHQVWNCANLVYKYYEPVDNDLVVDLGAGYGEEAIYLLRNGDKNIRYIGVEAQPVIYECLANTFFHAGRNFIASPYVITDKDVVKFFSQQSYAAVGQVPEAYIEVPTITWQNFLTRYEIKRIDLFKMNIEGAEQEVLQSISDFSIIKRFIISCHDFRAENGEGEWYRTKATVKDILVSNGYKLRGFDYGINWADDWIYAERD